jgi:hypothetical protein
MIAKVLVLMKALCGYWCGGELMDDGAVKVKDYDLTTIYL